MHVIEVGPKNRKKSLVVGIPSKIAEECNINTSTIFAVRLGDQKRSIMLEMIDASREKEVVPVAVSLEANSNQVSEVQ
jgi:hypothetical protein